MYICIWIYMYTPMHAYIYVVSNKVRYIFDHFTFEDSLDILNLFSIQSSFSFKKYSESFHVFRYCAITGNRAMNR